MYIAFTVTFPVTVVSYSYVRTTTNKIILITSDSVQGGSPLITIHTCIL